MMEPPSSVVGDPWNCINGRRGPPLSTVASSSNFCRVRPLGASSSNCCSERLWPAATGGGGVGASPCAWWTSCSSHHGIPQLVAVAGTRACSGGWCDDPAAAGGAWWAVFGPGRDSYRWSCARWHRRSRCETQACMPVGGGWKTRRGSARGAGHGGCCTRR